MEDGEDAVCAILHPPFSILVFSASQLWIRAYDSSARCSLLGRQRYSSFHASSSGQLARISSRKSRRAVSLGASSRLIFSTRPWATASRRVTEWRECRVLNAECRMGEEGGLAS